MTERTERVRASGRARPSLRQIVRKTVGMLGAAAVLATGLTVMTDVVAPTPVFAAGPLSCDGSTVYAINGGGEVRAFNAETGDRFENRDFTLPGLGTTANGLAINGEGTVAYGITNDARDSAGNRISIYDVIENTHHTVRSPFDQVLRGSVNPVNGYYYFAGGGVNAPIGVYDPDSDRAYQVGTLTGLTSGNGDFAFSSSGELLIVANTDIYVLADTELPTTESTTATFPTTNVASLGSNSGNGVAFGGGGFAFVSTGTTIPKVNPANGALVSPWTLTTPGFGATDMASCAFPNTLSLKKDLASGRFADTDEFTLRISGQDYLGTPVRGTSPGFITATTDGPATGVQTSFAGPAFVAGGNSFEMRETGTRGSGTKDADLRNYLTSFACVDNVTGYDVTATVNGDPQLGGHWGVTVPNNLKGSDVVCTIVNDRADITLTKQTDPTDATFSADGDVLTYVLRAENTGPTDLTDVTITDLKLGELRFSQWSGAPNEFTGKLERGQWVEMTGTYTVTQSDVNHGSVDNTASVVGTTPAGDEVTDKDDITVNANLDPSITLVKSSNANAPALGDTVTYTFVAENTGNVTLTGVTIADPLEGLSALTYDWSDAQGTGVLEPGDTVTATATLTVTQAHVDARKIINTATVTGTPPNGPNVTEEDTEPVIPKFDPKIDLTKVATPIDGAKANDTVTYTFTATNTGNVALSGVTITDPMTGLSELTFDWSKAAVEGSLAPGETVTATATYTLTQADITNGTVDNTATAVGTPPNAYDPADPTGPGTPATPVDDEDTETVKLDHDPSLSFDKTGVLNDTGEAAKVGDLVTFTFVAKNTGNVALTNVTITDPKVGLSELTYVWPNDAVEGTLEPGETVTATATYALTQADLDAGHVANVATATGTPPADPENPSEPPKPLDPIEGDTIVEVSPAPAIELTKTSEVPDDARLGDTITFTLVAENIGNVTLTDVTITDPMENLFAVSTDWSKATAEGTLAPGEIVTVTAELELTQQLIDHGWVTNTAHVEGTPPNTFDPKDPEGPGDPSDPVDDEDTEVPLIPAKPVITLVKSAKIDTTATAGETVTYTFVGTNTGNVTLTDVTITDPMDGLSALTFDWSGVTTEGVLAPEETVTATATYVLTQADIDRGSIDNLATATGTPPAVTDPENPDAEPVDQDPVTDEDDVTLELPQGPALSFGKTGEREQTSSTAAVGDVVTFTFAAQNIGNVTLTDVAITDVMPGLSPLTYDWGAATGEGILAPGERVTATATYALTQADINAGQVFNVGSVTGTPPSGPSHPTNTPLDPIEDKVTVPVPQDLSITLDKTSEFDGEAVVGDTVTFTFAAENTGNVTLTDVTIIDPMPGLTDLVYDWSAATAEGVLEPGETVTATASLVLTQEHVDAGMVRNFAIAEGTPPSVVDPENPNGPRVPAEPVDDDSTTVKVLPGEPGISLEKTAKTGGQGVVGDRITYTLTATNTGNVTLTGVSIADELKGLSALTYDWSKAAIPGTLAPGEQVVATASYVITEADAAAGKVVNAATATGQPPAQGDPNNPLTPPVTSDPVTDDDTVTTLVGPLAHTGAQLLGGMLSTGLVLIGVGLMLWMIRRAKKQA